MQSRPDRCYRGINLPHPEEQHGAAGTCRHTGVCQSLAHDAAALVTFTLSAFLPEMPHLNADRWVGIGNV